MLTKRALPQGGDVNMAMLADDNIDIKSAF